MRLCIYKKDCQTLWTADAGTGRSRPAMARAIAAKGGPGGLILRFLLKMFTKPPFSTAIVSPS